MPLETYCINGLITTPNDVGGGGAKCLKKHGKSYQQTIAHNALKESDFL